MYTKICPVCSRKFTRVKNRFTFCSLECYWQSITGGTHDWGHKISKTKKGVKFSEEHKKNLSLAKLGRKQSPEQIEKRQAKLRGALNVDWKGDKVGYFGLHAWIRRNYGTPKKCEHCGKDNLQGRAIHWANKTGKYLRERNDWIRLCTACHGKYDTKNNLRNRIFYTRQLSKG